MAVICVEDIAYVRYQAPDLDAMEKFLVDFGMTRAERTGSALYMRGCGSAPFIHVTEQGAESKCLGFGLQAQREADLETLAKHLGRPVEESAEPGGGRVVQFADPDGFHVAVVFGRQTVEPMPVREPVASNPSVGRKRLGETVRIPKSPSHIMRIGHIALLVSDFHRSRDFYHELLGLMPSDTYYAGEPENKIAAFMRCGLGKTYTDHHTMALIPAPDGEPRFDHSSFEVIDMDDLMRGNEHLAAQGHTHSWGIGRHVEGSQLFDYWRDPFGHKHEHWTDGDQVNDDTPVGNAEISAEAIFQWAPPLSQEFFK